MRELPDCPRRALQLSENGGAGGSE